ncbi:MAG: hypothetical protein Q9208_003293 [Pyrenodesmia sp. 3 TL-2023]
MTTEGGASPRPFDASDSQADMSWLESQQGQSEAPINNIAKNFTDLAKEAEQTESIDIRTTLSKPALTPNIVKQEPTTPERWLFSQEVVDLTDGTPNVKQEHSTELLKDWKAMPSHIDLSDTGDELGIKKEPLTEPLEDWKAMPSHIDLSDTEDGLDLIGSDSDQKDTHGVDAKGKGPESDHGNNSNDNPLPATTNINLGRSILRTPNSKAKRAAYDPVKTRQLMAMHREKALKRDREIAANLHAGHSSSLGETPSDPVRIVEDALPSGNNTADGDQNDSLFLPQGSSKRPHVATMESDSEVQEISENIVPATKGKPKRKRQARFPDKSPEELRRLQECEENASLAIGLELFLNRGSNSTSVVSRRETIPATYDGRPGSKGKRKETKGAKAAKAKPKRPSKKGKKNSTDANIDDLLGGLQSHDVLAEANANLERAALPSFRDTNTRDLLKSLRQSVPDDERPGVWGEKKRLNTAATNFGHGVVTGKDGGWRFKGMKSTLMHHQLLGASFMRERELGDVQPYGGLLADEMGFGKTVMMIATMVTNPPSRTDRAKSTLIVCSNSLMRQWRRELANHANDGIFNTIIVHHGTSQIEGEGVEAVLSEADVVLTTYGQVVKSFPLDRPPEQIESPEDRRAWWEKHWGDQAGLLHKTHFHRVVLDESQVIKNHKAHTSIACQALKARYRWAISGTPILNRVEEFYPYFKFLRAPFAGSFDEFRLNFCGKGDRKYTDRLHVCLKQFMLRRTHKDLIFGKPIIKLPECHTETVHLRPTKVEMSIYRALEFRYAQAVNAVARWGSEQQIHRATMTMLTRLRQMTAHLFLVQQVMQDIFELDDVEQLRALVKENTPSQDMVMAIQALIANKEDDEELDDDYFGNSNNETQEYSQPSPALLLKFQDHLKSLIANSDASEFAKRTVCPRCGQPPEDPHVTSCLHVYCYECLLVMGHEAGLTDEGAYCLECGVQYDGTEPCVGVKELNHEMATGFDAEGNLAKKKRHKPPKDLLKWIRKDGGVLPSSKSAAVVDQIDKWLTEEPEKKIIVFCQWRMMYYHGGMNNKQRDKAIDEFGTEPGKQVLVASLKCGGLGLNLTMASKIICVDLWFNSFIEQQESETYVNRLVLKGTVDERLIALQERKKKLIGRALGDTQAFKHFSAEDLMRLFGHVKHDEHDRPFIVVDDEQGRTVGE